MPQLQNLVLKDRASPAVDHTFTPRDVVSNVGTVESSSGMKVGDKTFSISVRKTANGRYKATIKFVVPVVASEVINGVTMPKVINTAYVDTTFTFDQTSTTEQRDNVVGMFASAFESSKTLVNDAVVGLQGIY